MNFTDSLGSELALAHSVSSKVENTERKLTSNMAKQSLDALRSVSRVAVQVDYTAVTSEIGG